MAEKSVDFSTFSVKEWLSKIPASVKLDELYLDTFLNNGFDDIKSILTLTENDLVNIGVSVLGHIRKLEIAIAELKKDTTATSSSQEKQQVKSNAIKAKRQTTLVLTFGIDGKFLKLEGVKLQPKYPWSNFLIPNPHSERLRFDNSIVEPLFLSAGQHLGAGFHQHLLQQQRDRWNTETLKRQLSQESKVLFENEKTGHLKKISQDLLQMIYIALF